MADLFDLKPATDTVDVDGKSIAIRAIDLAGALQIIMRFPALKALVSGGKKEVSFAELAASGSVPAIIASGCGRPNDDEAEAQAATLDADTQAMLLMPILSLTMPRGAVPFLVRVIQFAAVLSPSPPPTREEIARKVVEKATRKSPPPSSLSSSSNTEAQSATMPS